MAPVSDPTAELSTSPAPRSGSPSLGEVTRAVWSLLTPDWFDRARPDARGVHYREQRARGIRPRADVFMPPDADGRTPTVLIVHGGGFLIGSRAMKPVRYLTSRLISSGVGVCAVDYRMIFRGGRLEEQVEDVRNAIGWWLREAEGYGADPGRITLLGISAGGALCVLAAGQLGEQAALHRQIGVFGVYDFTYLGGLLASALPRWLLRTRDRGVWARRSPIRRPLHPAPTLLLHGTRDRLVPVGQAHELHRRRTSLGLATETVVLDGEPHAFLNWAGPAADTASEAIIRFATED